MHPHRDLPFISIYATVSGGKNKIRATGVYISKKAYELLNNPKELTFLLDSNGCLSIKEVTVDTTKCNKIHKIKTGGGWTEAYKTMIVKLEEEYNGHYIVAWESGYITLTKLDEGTRSKKE